MLDVENSPVSEIHSDITEKTGCKLYSPEAEKSDPITFDSETSECEQKHPSHHDSRIDLDSPQPSSLTNDHNTISLNEIKDLKDGLAALTKQVALFSETADHSRSIQVESILQVEKLRYDSLLQLNEKLEQNNSKMQNGIQELSQKLLEENQIHITEKCKLESQLEVVIQDKTLLQSKISELKQHIQAVDGDNVTLNQKLEDMKYQLENYVNQVETSKAHLDLLNHNHSLEVESLTVALQTLEQSKKDVERQLEVSQSHLAAANSKVDEYQTSINRLENDVLASRESELTNAIQQLEERAKHIDKLEVRLVEIANVAERLETEKSALLQNFEKKQEAMQSSELNFCHNMDAIQSQLKEKECELVEMRKALDLLQTELENERQRASQLVEEMASLHSETQLRINELENALEDTMTQLDETEAEKKRLENIRSTDLRMIEQLSESVEQLKGEVESKEVEARTLLTHSASHVSEASELLAKLQSDLLMEKEKANEAEARAQQFEDANKHLKEELQLSRKELELVSEDMKSVSDREKDLLQKWNECDRVRRELHGRVMQLVGNIRVFVRVRPVLPGEEHENEVQHIEDVRKRKRDESEKEALFRYPGIYDRVEKRSNNLSSGNDVTKNMIELTEPYKDRGGLKDRRKQWKFGFDNIFSPNNSQEDVWEATEPLVQSAVDGYNVTIFAYGQTGSGKTYTMLGSENNPGLISRSINKFFNAKREIESLTEGATNVSINVELLEVYNEQVWDLLSPNSGPNGRELALKVTSKDVVGNIVVAANTEDEVMQLLSLAQSRRCVKATASNAESSRSHMIFTIHFSACSSDGLTRNGKLNICDLAGSERLSKSNTHLVGGSLLHETKHINKSLSTLSNVIEKLQAGEKNIPFRESKLTYILQNSLGGNSKTLAIICCNPLPSHFHESLCSLRFAEKVNRVDLKKAVADFGYKES
jgi:hypothetical protein